jgi:glycosyltransferase involved in cell wall biosynthesis
MKLLLSSTACDPFGGSETVHGWRACRAIARDHEVWILTAEENRPGLEKGQREGLVPEQMHFIFVGENRPAHENRLIARFQSWHRYLKFSEEMMPLAREAHRRIGFDRAHHVTYTTWRVACPLWKLGIPLIWGPISGTEIFPLPFFRILSPSAQAFEFVRMLSSGLAWVSPGVRECARRSARIIAIHDQAYEHLVRLRGSADGVTTHSGFFFPDDHIAQLERPPVAPSSDQPLRIFASGNVEGRKGIALALMALAELRRRGVEFTYTVSSRGAELAHLQRLAVRLGLADCVSLGVRMEFAEFLQNLKRTDVYLLPSLREGGGLTLMEAMLAGCVPVVAQCGGPGNAVTPECGFPVPVTTVEDMVGRLADALAYLAHNRQRLPELGRLARQRIVEHYNEASFRRAMNEAYESV